jgi:hypothetical protein
MITTITRQVVKQCPYKNETDVGELTVVIDGEAPELHDLAERVDKLAAGAQVTTRWETGPWRVEVTIGDFPR